MATPDCNDELAFVCEECYRVVYDDCQPIVIDVGLSGDTEYCFKFLDKFGVTHQYLATTESDGSFTIDETQLPDSFFNQYAGIIELQIFADCDTETREQFTVAYTQYNCLLLQNAESVEDDDSITAPGGASYVAVKDGSTTTNVPCGGEYTCEGGSDDITYNVYVNSELISTTTQSADDDLTINILD